MATKIFVNLPVKNLNQSVEFFTKLGCRLISNLPMRLPHAWS